MKKNKHFILNIPPEKADKLIEDQIVIGETFKEIKIINIQQWKNAEKKFNAWNLNNYNLLKSIFKNNKVCKDYSSASWSIGRVLISDLKLSEKIDKLHKDISNKIDKLSSIRLSLDMFKVNKVTRERDTVNKLFFIHGTNCSTKTIVLNFIADLGLEPIILKDLAAGGKTLIDEIQNILGVKFAIALLTPDDIGGTQPEKLNFRADQNTILELGIFIGFLGRDNVCGLYDGNLELPEDYHGFSYIKIDKSENWKKLVSEVLKKAGYNI
ncbi:MAG: nucleotide-binding protein [Candidatus Cloacimonetes bacterium]|nr:nucleotide-binding protein [Candidatus Cloacimonadota bacterium]